jgi:cellulose synthase/poly-beta-1,6-N-acetylglucosamine synthase-like glycosyltransferase/beta-mannanase
MQEFRKAPAPSRKEVFTLRLMIMIGLGSMGYFLFCLFDPAQVGYAPFYWMLMMATTFHCLRVLHEWYHYFNVNVPPEQPLTKHFTVDIFTTFCPGEPYSMIVKTLEAVQAITYPHNTYLCDEANDPYLKEVCRRLGVHHITRTNRIDAKAGNINNALRQSSGELCVVLDPDHVPLPSFLDYVVPYFADEQIGFVQVVQAYGNLRDSLIAKGAAQQTFQFYGPMMMTMNRYGTVLAIGANCTFRRTALESIGGHAAGLAEDMHTSMQLHAKGWKSLYLPAVLTYGLVPSTLSAYYKQQLKWARGTFELLFTTYPALFKKFTWRQRIHYGSIPFHYFSGVIFLINFLVPILSLVFGLIPFQMDLLFFTIASMPFLASTLAVRLFVQRWVMGEGEQGNHAVGGLLLIGTWWVHILGLFYTLIRKKVPYIPTPKDGNEANNWGLNMPNILVGLASLFAIFYGLSVDWNPYALVMACIAWVNFTVMGFNVMISRRNDLKRIKERFRIIKVMFIYWRYFKQQFWNFRHHVLYSSIRRFALPLIIVISFAAIYAVRADKAPVRKHKPNKQDVFYSGIYSPGPTGGLTEMRHVLDQQQQYKAHVNIISLYIPWGDEERCLAPVQLIDSIYRNGSLPMITWEPWGSLFNHDAGNERKIFARIVEGDFDAYLQRFARQIRSFARPVFIRFAHEFDNPFYPWSAQGENTAEEFRAAWKYVHDLFIREGAHLAIWVWNPWKPATAEAYFPGMAYVDWLGVTGLNYGTLNPDGKALSFRHLYEPFHQLPIFRAGLPVIVSEAGSLRDGSNQEKWMQEALADIDTTFREIKALVFFNSAQDNNLQAGVNEGTLNWQMHDPGIFFKAAARRSAVAPKSNIEAICELAPLAAFKSSTVQTSLAAFKSTPRATINSNPVQRIKLPDTIRGMNYQKGQNWFRNIHAVTRLEAVKDMQEMRALGINVIKRTGPGVYDRNILAAAKQCGMRVHYNFRMPELTDIHAKELSKLSHTILSTVNELKHDTSIMAWNISNATWQQLESRYYKPDLLYRRHEWLGWLRELIAQIKAADPRRPVTVDVAADERLMQTMQVLNEQLPRVDAFGLLLKEETTIPDELPGPWFISQTPVPALPGCSRVFIAAWQDQSTRDQVTFNGIKDHEGRKKPGYYQLAEQWGQRAGSSRLPAVKILRPAQAVKPGEQLTYHALIRPDGQWTMASSRPSTMKFEWYLVKTDEEGNPMLMERLGEGASVTLRIPETPASCRLYLIGSAGNDAVTHYSMLHTPLTTYAAVPRKNRTLVP